MTAQSRIAALLKETMGLEIGTVGVSTVKHAVSSRMSLCRIRDAGAYWDYLRESPAELQELIEAVVVPETWFFRDREAFTALAKSVTTKWMPARADRTLRILSVPSSTGEEPYSIAMTLLDSGVSADTFVIDAIDISARALAIARRGIFGRNSFRAHDLAFRDRHFRRTEQGFEILPAVRERVRFEQGNLLSLDRSSETARYDVIFCRNVLIYFDAAMQQHVVKSLHRLLAADGVLFVGPAEAFLARAGEFVSANEPRAFAYRKGGAAGSAVVRVDKLPPRPMRKTAAQSRASVRQAEPPQPGKRTDTLEIARRLADAGKLDEATSTCEAHLREHGASSAALYLLGLLRDASGNTQRAAECYRKVLFLEPNHSEALMHLALLEEKRGDTAAARRLQLRASRSQSAART